jgi:hypothetical protein
MLAHFMDISSTATVTGPWALRRRSQGFWPIGPQADVSAVIVELPDLNHFPVLVIAIPLAFRRTAWKRTNGPAVQSLTWTPTVKNPRLKKVFPRTETGPLLSSENFQEQKRASLSGTQIHANNWF